MRAAILVVVSCVCNLCLSACHRAPAAGPGDGAVDLNVGASTLHLGKAVAELRQRADDLWKLSLKSHDGELNRLVIELDGSSGKLADWVGKATPPIDVGVDNPKHLKMGVNNNINRFRARGNYYEALRVGGTVRGASDARVDLDLSGVFLEVPDTDQGDEAPGREVSVSGSASVPWSAR